MRFIGPRPKNEALEPKIENLNQDRRSRAEGFAKTAPSHNTQPEIPTSFCGFGVPGPSLEIYMGVSENWGYLISGSLYSNKNPIIRDTEKKDPKIKGLGFRV